VCGGRADGVDGAGKHCARSRHRAGRRGLRQTVDVLRPRPSTVALVLAVYVLPLTAAVLFLVSVGLPVLALGLVAVEGAVVAAVVVARRDPGPNG
jgi:hypothetical protein